VQGLAGVIPVCTIAIPISRAGGVCVPYCRLSAWVLRDVGSFEMYFTGGCPPFPSPSLMFGCADWCANRAVRSHTHAPPDPPLRGEVEKMLRVAHYHSWAAQ